jgi:hypothetical protein
MPLSGDAKTKYQREYMRRMRAGAKSEPKAAPSKVKPAKAEPDPGPLSMSAQEKLDAHKRRLDREHAEWEKAFEWRLSEAARVEVLKRTEERFKWMKEQEEQANKIINGYKGVMTRSLFKRVQARCHPDAGGNNELFIAFTALEKILVKDSLEASEREIRRTVEQWESRKRAEVAAAAKRREEAKAKAEARAKREAAKAT